MRVGIFGAPGIGKTRALAAWLRCAVAPTLGVECHSTWLDGHAVVIYDTCGSAAYDSLVLPLLQDLDAVLIMYDIASRRSFGEALIWLNRANPRRRPCALVGIPGASREVDCVAVSAAVRPWVRQGASIWADELEARTLPAALRYFLDKLRKKSILTPPPST